MDVQNLRNLIHTDSISLDESTGDSEESMSDEQLLARNSHRGKSTYLSSCPCETHSGKMYADRVFAFEVDEIFDMIFGDNSFSRAFHDSQRLLGRKCVDGRMIEERFYRLCQW